MNTNLGLNLVFILYHPSVMRLFVFFLLAMVSGIRCGSEPQKTSDIQIDPNPADSAAVGATEIASTSTSIPYTIGQIALPLGYVRAKADQNSYASYLRNLPLHPPGTMVRYYDGSYKANRDVYHSVINLPIGTTDLHQCADAIMRLQAEYLYQAGRYDDIHFDFTNGFRVEYAQWRKGRRIVVNENRTTWDHGSQPSTTYEDFWAYLETVFMYAGTASLRRELTPKAIANAEIGDILIQGGHPGHAVIVIDKAYDESTQKPIYLLAQSYMPAQEIQILKNREDTFLSPWYVLEEGGINTPEWAFHSDDLMTF